MELAYHVRIDTNQLYTLNKILSYSSIKEKLNEIMNHSRKKLKLDIGKITRFLDASFFAYFIDIIEVWELIYYHPASWKENIFSRNISA